MTTRFTDHCGLSEKKGAAAHRGGGPTQLQ